MTRTTVMLVDDHAVVRVGFRLLLQAAEDLLVVAEADSGEQAIALFAEAKPDIVVMDLAMAGAGGIEAIKRIIARDERARILALSAHEDMSHPKRALKAGALGYLSKRTAPETLIEAIRIVAAGGMYIDAAIARHMAAQDLSGGDQNALSFYMAGSLPLDLDFKQNLLATRSEGQRIHDLAAYLEKILPVLRRAARARETAGGNGHVH